MSIEPIKYWLVANEYGKKTYKATDKGSISLFSF